MQFSLDEINKIKDYFIAEIREKETISKMLSKYIAAFDYFDKTLLVLSAAFGIDFIASFASVTGVSVGIVSASFGLMFSISNGTVQKFFKTMRKEGKKTS